jgi:hypothetical protein
VSLLVKIAGLLKRDWEESLLVLLLLLLVLLLFLELFFLLLQLLSFSFVLDLLLNFGIAPPVKGGS